MFPPRNILVPSDFSENVEKALACARAFAREYNATIHIVHVIEPVMYPVHWGLIESGYGELIQELIQSAEKELARLSDRLIAEKIGVRTMVLEGYAHREILQYAENSSIDLICIAMHSRSGFERFLIGSTTERVVRRSRCPVLTVPIVPNPAQVRNDNTSTILSESK